MALGQNEQFFYSPDVRIFINSITQGGIIEVSDDFMSLNIERNINAVSTASIYLANNGFKYTKASLDFTATKVPPPVINTMDQVIIFLKKESYYQYFTGFVTYAPIVTLIPEPIVINCSCTLYKAQNSFWDAGAIEYEGILPGILQNSQIFGGNVQNTDGGVQTGIENLLTKVANWENPEQTIHIGGLPPLWVDFATNIYKQTQIQLKDTNATSFQDIINYLEVTGNKVKSVQGTTVQGKKGPTVNDGTTASLGFNKAPPGTAILNIIKGQSITATTATVNDLSQNAGADNIVPVNDKLQYWVAAPFTYWASNLTEDEQKAKQWLKGALGPDEYPSSAQIGRILLITNPTSGESVQVHVAYAIQEKLLNNADIILSEAAFTFLGGTQSSNIISNLSIDDWLTSSAGTLKGGSVPTTKLTTLTSSYSLTTLATKQKDPNNGPRNSYSGLYAMSWPDILATGIVPATNGPWTSALWAICLLLLLGAPVTNNNIIYIGSWISKETGGNIFPNGVLGNWLRNNNPLNATLNSNATNSNALSGSLESYYNWYPTASDGLQQTANMINQFNMAPILRALSNKNGISPSNFFAALQASAWTGGPPAYVGDSDFISNDSPPSTICFENTPQSTAHNPGGTIPVSSTTVPGTGGIPSNPNASIPGLSNVGGNYNFNTTQGVVGYDVNSTILAGSPRAFVTDVSVLSTISTLATMGLREFQSGPDGSFIAWYPDYFGLYGTAPVLSIYDIEIIDFSLYHDDTQLYTHIGVSGDPTEVGDVSLVDWLMTNGIITIENNAILGLLFGSDPATLSTNMSSLISQGIDVNNFAKQFLKRYGMRPYVDSEPMIRSQLMEFMYALQEFLYLWSQQYATNVTFTFMPELYPGMIVKIAEHGLQVYVQSVNQSCSRDGGFTTSAVVTCPTRVIGTKTVNGKTVPNVVPVDFGYPIVQIQDS